MYYKLSLKKVMGEIYKTLRITVNNNEYDDIHYVHSDYIYENFVFDIGSYQNSNDILTSDEENDYDTLSLKKEKQFTFSRRASKKGCCKSCVIC